MRAHHVIAVVAVLVIGLAAKQFLFPAKEAQAGIHVAPNAGLNVLQMHIDHPNIKGLPVQTMHDMTFAIDNDRPE